MKTKLAIATFAVALGLASIFSTSGYAKMDERNINPGAVDESYINVGLKEDGSMINPGRLKDTSYVKVAEFDEILINPGKKEEIETFILDG